MAQADRVDRAVAALLVVSPNRLRATRSGARGRLIATLRLVAAGALITGLLDPARLHLAQNEPKRRGEELSMPLLIEDPLPVKTMMKSPKEGVISTADGPAPGLEAIARGAEKAKAATSSDEGAARPRFSGGSRALRQTPSMLARRGSSVKSSHRTPSETDAPSPVTSSAIYIAPNSREKELEARRRAERVEALDAIRLLRQR